MSKCFHDWNYMQIEKKNWWKQSEEAGQGGQIIKERGLHG